MPENKPPNPTELSTEIEEVIGQLDELSDVNSNFAKDSLLSNVAGDPLMIGKYQVQRLLASGGQAIAMLAYDPVLERQVVVKLYHLHIGEKYKEQILNEGKALAQVDSPYVAKCFGGEMFESQFGLVLEYIPGPTIAQLNKPLSVDEICEIIKKMAEGVGAVHAAGLLHRDLKPSNIVLQDNRTPKIIDFGLVSPISDVSSSESSGTTAFMSPERARSDLASIDHRSDLFGIGAIFFFLLTNKAPFEADSKEDSKRLAIEGKIQSPRNINNKIPKRLEKICCKLLVLSPQDRYQNTDKLIREIDSYLSLKKKVISSIVMILAAALLAVGFIAVWSNPFTKDESKSTSNSKNIKSEGSIKGSKPTTEAVWPDDVEVFFKTLANGKRPTLRTDFDVEWNISNYDDPNPVESFIRNQNDIAMTINRNVRLSFKSDRRSFVRVYSIQCSVGSNQIDEIVALNCNPVSDYEWESAAEPFSISPTKEFFLVIIAAQKSSGNNSPPSASGDSSSEIYRGVKAINNSYDVCHVLIAHETVSREEMNRRKSENNIP